MKRIISIITALMLILTSADAFAATAGMKDVKTTNESSVVTISVGDCENNQIPFSISFKSGVDVTEYYTVNAFYGEEKINVPEVILSPGGGQILELAVEDVLHGRNTLDIKVLKNDGTTAASYAGEFDVLTDANIGYLEQFTRRVGMSGSYSIGRLNGYSENGKFGSGRLEFGWGEEPKGTYHIDLDENVAGLHEGKYDIIALAAYNNTLYEPRGRKYGPDKKEVIDAYANFVNAIRDKYPFIEYYEVWNEPNGTTFWNQGKNETDYTYLAEVTRARLKKEDENAKTLVGVVANGDTAFVRKILEEGLYANMDVVANHPYIRPAKVDAAYHNMLSGMTDLITMYGGWKEQYITEVGWPTHTSGISQEQAAIELVKQVIVADYYDITQNQYYMVGDSIYDPNYNQANSEHNFGVIYTTKTGRPNQGEKYKPSWFSIKTMLDETNGAIYAGMLPFEDRNIQASLYLRDGEVICVIWTKGAETTVTFDGEVLNAVDMNGNPVSGTNTFTIGEKPIYIHGLGRDILLKNLPEKIESLVSDRMETAFAESEQNKGFQKAKEILMSDVDLANELISKGTYPTEEEALSYLERHYSITDEILEMYKSGELEVSEAQLNGLLFVNYWTGNIWTAIYMMAVDGNNDIKNYDIVSTKSIENAKKVICEKADEATLSFSEAILQYAKNYNEKAIGISELRGTNPLKAGAVKGWDMLSKNIAELTIKMAEAETVRHDNILLQLLSTECEIELSTHDTIYPSVYNNRKTKPLTGYAELVAPNGETVSKSEEVTINAEESAAVAIDVLLLSVADGRYKVRFVENGEVIAERNAYIKGKNVYNVTLEPTTKTFDEIDTLALTIENLKEEELGGTIELKPLCNWSVESSVKEFSVESLEKISLKWSITDKESAAYHFYPFEITIKDRDGNIRYNKKQMQGFSLINRTGTEFSPDSFTGDISGWENAYPMYGSYPENPEIAEEWRNQDLFTRSLAMWDDNYFYIVYDVVDQYHANLQAASSIWNGDCVQFAFDTLNDGVVDKGYAADDYEYGVAYTEELGDVAYCWQSPDGGKDVPDEWTKRVRDDKLGISRYMVKIPKDNLNPLEFKEGNVFGYTAAFDDSDWGTREKYVELTSLSAIAATKRPWVYYDFVFVDDKAYVNKDNECPLPTVLGYDDDIEDVGSDNMFEDIEGHWAANLINYFARKGIINGVDENHFEPDREITRAEFVTLLCKVRNVYVADSWDMGFTDVKIDEWYTQYANRAGQWGIIPKDVERKIFRPNEPITREEAFSMCGLYWIKNGKPTGDYKPLIYFDDCNEINESDAEAIQVLYNNGIIQGDDNKLRPKGHLTRAEATSLLKKFF